MVFYKYRSFKFKFLTDIIKNQQLYCAQFETLNDPSECRFSSPKEFDEEILKQTKNRYGICSLSLNYWNNLMWCLYAQNHTGCCIVVDIRETQEDNEKIILPIKYSRGIKKLKNKESIVESIAHKTSDWAHEQETRVLIPITTGNHSFVKVEIKSIIVGCRALKSNITRLKKLVKKYNLEIPIFQMDREVFSFPFFKSEKDELRHTCLHSLKSKI